MKYIAWSIILLILVGCASKRISLLENAITEYTYYYKMNQEYSTKIGEPIIKYERAYYYEGYISLETFQTPSRYPQDNGVLISQDDTLFVINRILYKGRESDLIAKDNPTDSNFFKRSKSFLISVNENGTIADGWFDGTIEKRGTSNNWNKNIKYFEKINSRILSYPRYKEEVVYMGIENNVLKVQLRVYAFNMYLPDYTKDYSLNLNQTKKFSWIGIKGEVIEATDEEIVVILTYDGIKAMLNQFNSRSKNN